MPPSGDVGFHAYGAQGDCDPLVRLSTSPEAEPPTGMASEYFLDRWMGQRRDES